ncbi:LPS export ABC transporter permease LptF [Lutimaribacter marinistellae]|uniref:LPS export ABC transporter permease LptF n=1 Tax=Lutimaribacter marinistellae TaxID=1820329 RepID=A0ABV7TGX2_9RHOB
MSRFDEYFLRQLLVLFGFFTLVLVGVFWITRSVSLFDTLISGGQSAMVFLEFTALTLPTLIRTVMPMAVFGAAVYVTNRLSRESELTVMLATGSSPMRLARPVLVFGLVAAVMMGTITIYLRPASLLQLEQREAEVARDVTAQLLNEGEFMHPVKGVTFYIGRIDRDGTLNDVFLSDRRLPARPVTFSGSRAFLVSDGPQTNLVMIDGMALRYDAKSGTMSSTLFEDFSYDISPLIRDDEEVARNIRGIPTLELIRDRDIIREAENYTDGQVLEELHQRFAWATICIAVALVGFAALMLGAFSRFGLWPQILTAFGFLIALEGMRGVLSPIVVARPDLWWLLYAPTLTGLAVAWVFLQVAGRPLARLFRRASSVA